MTQSGDLTPPDHLAVRDLPSSAAHRVMTQAMNQRGIGLILNPHAGGNRRRRDRPARLREILDGSGHVFAPTTLDELEAVAVAIRNLGIDTVAVCGGDGTYFRVLSALVRAYGSEPLPPFVPLRGGSMNTIAKALRCPAWSPERTLRWLVAARRDGWIPRTTARVLMRVNGEHYGLMTGAGTVVNFLRAYYDGGVKGPAGAAVLVSRLVTAALRGGNLIGEVFAWVDARITCDGQVLPHESFSLIYAASVEEIGLGFKPTYLGGADSRRFHTLAGPLDTRDVLRSFAHLYRGTPTRLPNLFDRQTSRVTVELREPRPYMINGDVMDAVTRLEIEAGPTVRFAAPGAGRASPSGL